MALLPCPDRFSRVSIWNVNLVLDGTFQGIHCCRPDCFFYKFWSILYFFGSFNRSHISQKYNKNGGPKVNSELWDRQLWTMMKSDNRKQNTFSPLRCWKPTKGSGFSCSVPQRKKRAFRTKHLRPTIMGLENRKQNRISLHRTETRDQCRRQWWVISVRCLHKKKKSFSHSTSPLPRVLVSQDTGHHQTWFH